MGNPNENPETAVRKFESMLKTDDVYFFDSEDFEEIIHHYLELGKSLLAKRAIALGLEQHPHSTELKILNVELLVSEDRFEKAEAILDELESYDPLNEEFFIQRANILSKKDQHHEAIEVLNEALKYTDDPFDLHSLLGMEHLYLDNYGEARKHFECCLEIDPMDYASLYNLIYCFEFLEQYEEAISFLNTYLEQNPYCEVAWHQIGKMYVELDMHKEALASFEFAIISDDKFTGAYFEKGRVLEKLGRFNEAIESYEISFEWDAPTASSYLRIGLCHQKLGNYQLAEAQFFKVIHEDPMFDQGWLALTKLFYIQGDYAKAQEYINKALASDSENSSFWKRAAVIYQALGNASQADYAFKQSVELGNYELNTFLKWAEVLLELKSYDAAFEVLEQGVEFYPDQSSLLYFIAGIYALKNQKEAAQTTMCKALRLDPSGAEYFYLYFEELTEVDWLKAYLEANKRTFSS